MAKYKSRFQGQVIDATLQAVIDGKAGIQGLKIDNVELTPDSENKVNISKSELNIPEVVQETGQSTSKVMSQNSVSSILSQKANLNDLSNVAYSGSYIDLSNKPNIPTKTSDLTNDSNFISNSDLSESYYNKSQTDNLLSSKANTNDLSTVATSGQYSDLSGLPSIPNKTSDLTNDSNFVSSSSLATVATSGSYNDLLDKPSIPSVIPSVVQTTGSSTTDVMSQNAVTTVIASKADSSNLSSVATSGSYNDLLNKPTIPTKTSDLTNDSNFVSSSNLATVATSGSYSDLSNKPTIPSVVQSTGSSTTNVMSQSAVTNAIPTIFTSYVASYSGSVYSTSYINNLIDLSSSEKVIGHWISNATLYRKTISWWITGVENTYYEYDTGISNASIMIIDPAYSFISGGGNLIMINSVRGNGTALTEHWNWFRVNSGGKIAYAFGSAISSLGGASCVLTLNYTKSS